MNSGLFRNARELFKPSGASALLYGAALTFADATRWWTHPMRAEGDLERMRFLDKVYWLSKAARPTRHALRGSGLEAYFRARAHERAALPAGFQALAGLTISSAGDLMGHPWLANSEQTLYADVAPLLFGSNLSMANLE